MSGPRSDHATHDETLVAAYAAGDLAGSERARARALVAGCPDCGRLVDDLRAIAAATRALPAPARPRDFRLTATDAARASVTREPSAAATRHSGVDPRRPLPTDHAEHDEALVAAYAAGDLSGPELARAEALTSACPACAELATDLVAIAATTRTLPAPARSRDFRLTAGDAARASGWWRGLRFTWTGGLRPLAVGLTTVGLAGMLVAVALPGSSVGTFMGRTAGDAARPPEKAASEPAAAPSAAASGAPVPAAGGAMDLSGRTNDGSGGAEPSTSPATSASGWSLPLFVLSGLVAVLGIALLFTPTVRNRRHRHARDRPDSGS